MSRFLINGKEMFLELLNDEDVKRKILEITGSGQYPVPAGRELEARLTELNEKLREEQKKNLELEKSNEINCMKTLRLQEELVSAKEELTKIKQKIQSVEPVADIWLALNDCDEDTLNYLDGLAGSRNVRAYIALGRDISRIRQLWQFIRDRVVAGQLNEGNVRNLSRYFDICIETYNMTDRQREKLEKLSIMEGDGFNSEICIKTSQSLLNGRITRVLINGYGSGQGRIAFPAIVIVQ